MELVLAVIRERALEQAGLKDTDPCHKRQPPESEYNDSIEDLLSLQGSKVITEYLRKKGCNRPASNTKSGSGYGASSSSMARSSPTARPDDRTKEDGEELSRRDIESLLPGVCSTQRQRATY